MVQSNLVPPPLEPKRERLFPTRISSLLFFSSSPRRLISSTHHLPISLIPFSTILLPFRNVGEFFFIIILLFFCYLWIFDADLPHLCLVIVFLFLIGNGDLGNCNCNVELGFCFSFWFWFSRSLASTMSSDSDWLPTEFHWFFSPKFWIYQQNTLFVPSFLSNSAASIPTFVFSFFSKRLSEVKISMVNSLLNPFCFWFLIFYFWNQLPESHPSSFFSLWWWTQRSQHLVPFTTKSKNLISMMKFNNY